MKFKKLFKHLKESAMAQSKKRHNWILLVLIALMVYATPITSNVVLTTSPTNSHSYLENLSVSWTQTGSTGNITDWRLEGKSIALLNMPFETNNSAGAGKTKDYSTYGNNGTVIGATWSATSGFDGKGAYTFKGLETEQINITTKIGTPSNITILAWTKRTTQQSDYQTLITYTNKTGYFAFQISTLANITYGAINNGYVIFNTMEANTWYHYALTYDGYTIRTYVNGTFVNNDTVSGGINYNQGYMEMTIGKGYGTGTTWNGTIDNVMIFNRTLSAQEILAIYNNQTNILVSQELKPNENWTACITPTNLTDGTMVCSNNLFLNKIPATSNVILVSTTGANTTNENLSVSWTTTDDDEVKNITDWRIAGTSIAVLNMPFEPDGNLNAKDYSTYGNNGTAVVNVTWKATGGHDGKGAYWFDEFKNGYVSIPDKPSLNITENLTITYWVNVQNIQDLRDTMIVHKGQNGANGLAYGCDLWCNGTSQVCANQKYFMGLTVLNASIYDTTYGTSCSTNLTTHGCDIWGKTLINGVFNDTSLDYPFIDPNKWYFIATTFKGGYVANNTLYINGVLTQYNDRPPITPVYLAKSATEVNIGNYDNGVNNHTINGTIDDVKIYDRILSSEEIMLEYTNHSNVMSNKDLKENETWTACIIPNDGYQDGTTVCSNTVKVLLGSDITPPSFNQTLTNITLEYQSPFSVQINVSDYDQAWSNDTTYFQNTALTFTNKTGLPLGTRSVKFSVNDSNNNINSTIIQVTEWDTTSPALTQIIGNTTQEYGIPLSRKMNATDLNLANFTLNDLVNFSISKDGTITNNTGLSLGDYFINTTVNDTSNNQNHTSFFVRVQDTIAPAWTQIPANVSIEKNNSFYLKINATDLLFANYSINDTTNFAITGKEITNATQLPIGTLSLLMTSNDTSNNKNTTIIQVTITNITIQETITTASASSSSYQQLNSPSVAFLNATELDLINYEVKTIVNKYGKNTNEANIIDIQNALTKKGTWEDADKIRKMIYLKLKVPERAKELVKSPIYGLSNITYIIATDDGNGKIKLTAKEGTQKITNILAYSTTNTTIALTCEGDLCKQINVQNKVTLKPEQLIKIPLKFTLSSNSTNFKIHTKDILGKEGTLEFEVTKENYNALEYPIQNALQPITEINGKEVPKIIPSTAIALLIGIVIGLTPVGWTWGVAGFIVSNVGALYVL